MVLSYEFFMDSPNCLLSGRCKSAGVLCYWRNGVVKKCYLSHLQSYFRFVKKLHHYLQFVFFSFFILLQIKVISIVFTYLLLLLFLFSSLFFLSSLFLFFVYLLIIFFFNLINFIFNFSSVLIT